MKESTDQIIRQAALELGRLHAATEEETGICGLLLGALYALHQADRFGYRDRTRSPLRMDYPEELASLAARIGVGEVPTEGQWLAGFFLNSALLRLQPASERMGKYANMRQDLVPDVRNEVNRLKHDVEGVISGRTVTLENAVDAAVLLVVAAKTICARSEIDG